MITKWLVGERRQNALSEMGKMMQCAKRAGIDHAITPGFGTLLGIVMIYDLLPNDHDMDMCIDTSKTTKEQDEAYLEYLKEAGLFKLEKEEAKEIAKRVADFKDGFRGKGPTCRSDNGRFLWFSLGEKDIQADNGVKCCNWFCFPHGGYYWHTKGLIWIQKISDSVYGVKPTDEAVAKGCPAKFYGEYKKIDFHGVTLNIPQYSGALVDYWYGAWHLERKGGQSSKKAILNIPCWNKPNKWTIRT